MRDLTVVVPTRNRATLLVKLLQSLKRQNSVGFTWEILVVNNGSTDRTEAIVKAHLPDFAGRLRYLYEKEPGLHRGRNIGAKNAEGQIIAYLDDDMILDNNWLNGIHLIKEGRADAVVGKILPKFTGAQPEWLADIYDGKKCGYLGLQDLGDQPKEVKWNQIAGGNCFIRREIVVQLGGFNPDSIPAELIKYRGDGECGFFKRFDTAGYKAMYDPIATAYHVISKDRLNLEYICRRAFNQGISDSYTEIRAKGGIQNKIHMQIQIAQMKGKIYHRESLLKDENLLEWVLKENYLEGKLN